jgi:hypothetical protein
MAVAVLDEVLVLPLLLELQILEVVLVEQVKVVQQAVQVS